MDDRIVSVLIADGWAHVRSTMRLLLAQEPHVVVVGEAGHLLSSTPVVKAFAMAVAICMMLLAVWACNGWLEIVPLTIFAAAAGVTIWIGTRVYRSMRHLARLHSDIIDTVPPDTYPGQQVADFVLNSIAGQNIHTVCRGGA